MQSHLELGEAEARLAIDACAAELRRRKKVGSIAVGDKHGKLIALLRMDGAPLPSAGIAANKVFTSSRLRQPSGALGRSALAEGWDVHYHGDIRYLGWDGGAPVFYRERRGLSHSLHSGAFALRFYALSPLRSRTACGC